jgi:peptide-methionine (S)-S-oxide reductase
MNMKFSLTVLMGSWMMFSACGQTDPTNTAEDTKEITQEKIPAMSNKNDLDTATFGAGCYWCVEAIFQQLKGVDTVVSGFTGGEVKNPSYEAVCNGTTGHAEVIQITYDPKIISFKELLEVFWSSHDPTTLNRQGYDVGTQYRSAIFYHSEEQKNLAEEYKKKLNDEGAFENTVVTEISAFDVFYPAKSDHQNYYNNNKSQGYCRMVIAPKLEKFEKVFGEKLK